MRFTYVSGAVRLIASLLVVVILGVSGGYSTASAASGPAIWKIDGGPGGGEVYLLGSVHMLKKGTVWFTPKIEAALAQSDRLVVETILDAAAQEDVKRIVMAQGFYTAGDRLQNHVDPKLFAAAGELGRQIGLSSATLDRLKPWYGATLLSIGFIQSHGYETQLGVDTLLQGMAAQRGMKVAGLETVTEQMNALAGASDEVQQAMLRDTVEQLKDMEEMLTLLTESWVKGDTKKLEKTLVEPMRDIPAAYEALLVRRNRNWAPKLIGLAREPGVHFVVVGAAHLIGKDSLVEMLKDKGVKAERY